MQVNNKIFTGRRVNESSIQWTVTGINQDIFPCPNDLVVKRFTAKSVVFEDCSTGKLYYTNLRIGNKILMAQQGLYGGPFVTVSKASSEGQSITWIGEVVY